MHCRFAERPAVGGCGLSQLNSRRRVLPKPLILFTPMREQADCSLIGTAPRPRATLRLVTRMLGLGQVLSDCVAIRQEQDEAEAGEDEDADLHPQVH